MVKFVGSFSSTLEFGHVVIISGTIRKSAENFTLNLLSDNSSADIPFHMNFVFGENSQIIRNSKIHGEFGAAENLGGMFTKEKNPLKAGDQKFNFFVNDKNNKFLINSRCVMQYFISAITQCFFITRRKIYIVRADWS